MKNIGKKSINWSDIMVYLAMFREAAKNIQRGGGPGSRGLGPQSPGPPKFSPKTMYPPKMT